MENGDYAFLNRLMHAFEKCILIRTIGYHVFTSNAGLLAKFDEFLRLELSLVIGSKAFQLSTGLIFDHCELVGEDREHPIFGSDRIRPHLRVETSMRLTKYEALPRD